MHRRSREICELQRQVPTPLTPPAYSRQDNPLHISLFPPHENELLELSFLLNSCLDIFEIRLNKKTVEQDLGLLQAVDERLKTYGWLTNTGIKFIIVVDMAGRPPAPDDDDKKKAALILGLRDSDLKPVCAKIFSMADPTHGLLLQAFRALHTAYIQLLQNPFYSPDDQTPMALANTQGRSAEITNARFIKEVQRIGKMWSPGIAAL